MDNKNMLCLSTKEELGFKGNIDSFLFTNLAISKLN